MQFDSGRQGPIGKICGGYDFNAGFVHHADNRKILFGNIQS
jgi:hypothetical protein